MFLNVYLLVTVVFLEVAFAGIHLQNPRGSGNRLDEPNRERRNRRRLFDSQANDRQGYNVGNMFYYQGSKLQIEWTNQHSCASQNANCDIILQYMCDDMVRDGSVLQTIPDTNPRCENDNCNTDIRFGMHEDFEYRLNCRLRSRNMGLFIGDLRMSNRAVNTRQNRRGLRHGFECPEERDYYPYWHPTPWKDIAVLTNDMSRCDYYKENSENVKAREYCYIPMSALIQHGGRILIPNNKADCEEFRFPRNDPNGIKGEWRIGRDHGIPAPECKLNQYSRDNHNGNGINGQTNTYNWTIPNIVSENCILRIRYNVTSNDFSRETSAAQNMDRARPDNGAKIPLYSNLGFASKCEAIERGFVFKNRPSVKVFEGLDVPLELAINSMHAGRTFQDRSFRFAVRQRPADVPQSANIYNLNVRGKRGNIVETYPSTEYDFVPSDLHVTEDDYIHIQWTGSNTNNNGNNGQGRAGSDRSNIVLLGNQVYPEGNGVYNGPGVEIGHFGVNYPLNVTDAQTGFSHEILTNLAYLRPGQYGGEMSELDDAGTYYNLGAIKAPTQGTYNYMCSRNNNFSNRDQKGRLIVHPSGGAPSRRSFNDAELNTLWKLLNANA